MTKINTNPVVNISYAGLFLALGLVLPFLTMQIPQIGSKLLPMHIPILLCGFICGPRLGLGVGLITPILRSVLFSAPPLFPIAVAMSFELAAYGFFAGLLFGLFQRKRASVYIALIVSMILGRIVWGIANYLLLGIDGSEFTLELFMAGAFINAIPGIIIQLILIPIIVTKVERLRQNR